MKRPKLSDAERLAADCPHCGAVPGEKCHDYRGKGKAWCVERGRPDITRRKLEKKADEKNAKARAEYGPLFAYLADRELTPVTADQLAERRWRSFAYVENSCFAETTLLEAFNWITLHEIRRAAADLIGREWAERLWAYCERTFKDSQSYYHTVFCQALTRTDEIRLAHELRTDPAWVHPVYNREGKRMICVLAFPPAGYAPPMTWPEFRDRFPWHYLHVGAPKNLSGPDDGGLFERTIGTLTGKAVGP